MKKNGAEADPLWMCDFAFLVYITEHLTLLNAQLQGREQLINELFQFVPLLDKVAIANYLHFPTLMENKLANPDT